MNRPAWGFVVSKAVGNAVTRNKVKRRLRELSASSVRDQPHGMDVVVRARPPPRPRTDDGSDDRGAAFHGRGAAGTMTLTAGPGHHAVTCPVDDREGGARDTTGDS
ncbi:ribonuclease P protein component [Kocuria rhizophila]|nr:ribonuclease P protein component [Kocuria rhizophila]